MGVSQSPLVSPLSSHLIPQGDWAEHDLKEKISAEGGVTLARVKVKIKGKKKKNPFRSTAHELKNLFTKYAPCEWFVSNELDL